MIQLLITPTKKINKRKNSYEFQYEIALSFRFSLNFYALVASVTEITYFFYVSLD